jgi:hypothetical protein
MTAIQIVALACSFDIPIRQNSNLDDQNEPHKFKLDSGAGR